MVFAKRDDVEFRSRAIRIVGIYYEWAVTRSPMARAVVAPTILERAGISRSSCGSVSEWLTLRLGLSTLFQFVGAVRVGARILLVSVQLYTSALLLETRDRVWVKD